MEPGTKDTNDAQTPGGVRTGETSPRGEVASTSRRHPLQAESSEPKLKWNRQRRSNLLRCSLEHFLGAAAPPSPSKSKSKFRLVSQQQIIKSEVASVLMSVLAHSPEISLRPKEEEDKASHVTPHFESKEENMLRRARHWEGGRVGQFESKEENMLRRRARWERRKEFLALDSIKWNEVETSAAPDADNILCAPPLSGLVPPADAGSHCHRHLFLHCSAQGVCEDEGLALIEHMLQF
ncbi:hypothetical protein CYMTET_27735 [Cymbomonas tetramitiformis]|uniref:Uncharacterized protein n=1 Tax=Cymbomonas tetramitiformis TaxID=36881 RepID=A0AAE0FPA1_9CHLO|nr:hypothetical protein CYMTET_27735 [Cymbomonas tetramitiformis]